MMHMKPVQEAYAAIRRRLLSKCKAVVSGRDELDALAPQYFRYIDCDKRVKEDWKRISYIFRLIGFERAAEIIQSDTTGILNEIPKQSPQYDELNAKLPLWKAMREFLRESGEAKVGDIRAFLEWMDYKPVSRQSLESAIRRHPKEFRVRTKGHERIVALRENEEGGSSDDQ
jgi:hypothetical protein